MVNKKRYQEIGNRIKEARLAADMSQKALADALGFDSTTAISFIEAGERKVSVEALEVIARVLHRDITFFLGEAQSIPDVRSALRATGKLTPSDEDKALDFINYLKTKRGRKSKS